MMLLPNEHKGKTKKNMWGRRSLVVAMNMEQDCHLQGLQTPP
jgi:hypothetical protein